MRDSVHRPRLPAELTRDNLDDLGSSDNLGGIRADNDFRADGGFRADGSLAGCTTAPTAGHRAVAGGVGADVADAAGTR